MFIYFFKADKCVNSFSDGVQILYGSSVMVYVTQAEDK